MCGYHLQGRIDYVCGVHTMTAAVCAGAPGLARPAILFDSQQLGEIDKLSECRNPEQHLEFSIKELSSNTHTSGVNPGFFHDGLQIDYNPPETTLDCSLWVVQ